MKHTLFLYALDLFVEQLNWVRLGRWRIRSFCHFAYKDTICRKAFRFPR